MTSPDVSTRPWAQAVATVTRCTYTAGAGRAIAFGIPTSRHFLIAFNYLVEGEMVVGQFSSRKALPQNSLFLIHYNPEDPRENDRSDLSAASARGTLLPVGLIGLVVLSLVCISLLRGCF